MCRLRIMGSVYFGEVSVSAPNYEFNRFINEIPKCIENVFYREYRISSLLVKLHIEHQG